jgi:signal transduction histidine kinase
MWRAVGVFRLLALAYAVAVAVANRHDYTRPALAWTLIGVMVVWTAYLAQDLRGGDRFYGVSGRASVARPKILLTVDLVLAVALVVATVAVVSRARIDAGAATLPGTWAAAAVLAWAVAGGPLWGVAAAAAVGAADFVERGAVTQTTVFGVALLLLAGGVGGYVVRLADRAAAASARVARVEAATAERERLAADIHDSVLQVLALVARRGAALGGEAAELGRLAAQQESALRTLVATPLPVVDDQGEQDLRALIEPLAGERVTVSCPAVPVPLASEVAHALASAARAALDNVDRHAGPAAQAWLLVEDTGDAVSVSIRDDGAGMAPDRLASARRDGRLGVDQSIVGRMRSVGGTAAVESAPGAGTEVELRVPRG